MPRALRALQAGTMQAGNQKGESHVDEKNEESIKPQPNTTMPASSKPTATPPANFNAAPVVEALDKLRRRSIDNPQTGHGFLSIDNYAKLADLAKQLNSPFAPIFEELAKPY